MAARLALDPMRRVVLTDEGRVDSNAPGAVLQKRLPEISEHLEEDNKNAVLVWTGSAWTVVMHDPAARDKYLVTRLPTTDPTSLVEDGVREVDDAVEAALSIKAA